MSDSADSAPVTFPSGTPVDEKRACKILGIAAEFIEEGWELPPETPSSLRAISAWIRSGLGREDSRQGIDLS